MKRRTGPALPLRIAVACLVALGVILALVAIAYLVATETTWGRARVESALESGLSDAIPGQVEVARVERASWKELVVSGLVFRDPRGEPTLSLDRARLRIEPAALLRGDVEIPEADVHGGTLRIAERPDGSVSIEQAFSSGSGPPSDLDLSIRNIRVNDLTVLVVLASGRTLRIANVYALTRIELRPGRGVVVRFDQVTGKVVEGLPLGELTLKRVKGRIRGKVQHVLAIEGPAHLLGDDFELAVDYYDREDTPVVVQLADLDFSLLGLSAVAADALSELIPGVAIETGSELDDGG